MRVAIATCQNIPEPDPDEKAVVAALERAGIAPSVLAWDDPAAPFAEHDLVVIRSTWNYFERVEEFVAWAESVAKATRLLNPPSIIGWNAKKTYLRELEGRGVDVVPTEFVEKGAKRSMADLLRDRGWEKVVVKPTVSAGSFRTERFGAAEIEPAQRFLDDLVRDRDAMVQKWMASVDSYGERSLVWIDGEVTHAIRKSPRFAGGSECVSAEVPIADDERAFATKALAPVASELLYARVDMVRDAETDRLRIMELELVEPSLFFLQAPRALERFVAAVARRAQKK